MIFILCSLVFVFVISIARNDIYVISDTHLNSEYISKENEESLKQFLLTLTNPDTTCRTLIIAGDFIEEWLYAPQEVPLSPSENLNVATLNGTLLKELIRSVLDNSVRVVYIVGNHDRNLKHSDFENAGLKEIETYQVEYRSHNYLIQHGHRDDLFTYEDYITKASPWSVPYSRLEYSDHILKDDLTVLSTFPKNPYVYSFHSEVVVLAIFVGVANATLDPEGRNDWEASFHEAKEIYRTGEWPESLTKPMKKGCFYDLYHGDERDIPSNTLIKKMVSIYERYWNQISTKSFSECFDAEDHTADEECRNNYERILMAIFASLKNIGYEYFVKDLIDGDTDLVIFGHTHQTTHLLTYVHNKENGHSVYVNAGGWVKKLKTYAIIHLDEETERGESVDVCEFVDPETPCRIIHSSELGPYHHHHHLSGEKKVLTVPSGWRCAKELYSDGKVCDCDCGVWDPDCDDPSRQTNCYELSPNHDFLVTHCNRKSLECEYTRTLPVPADWKCSEDMWMNSDRICYCNCSAFDPTCETAFQIIGCEYDKSTEFPLCMRNEMADGKDLMKCLNIPKNKDYSHVPEGWKCPKSWYNTMDGCDCECGDVKDPDCAKVGSSQCSCAFEEKTSYSEL